MPQRTLVRQSNSDVIHSKGRWQGVLTECRLPTPSFPTSQEPDELSTNIPILQISKLKLKLKTCLRSPHW